MSGHTTLGRTLISSFEYSLFLQMEYTPEEVQSYNVGCMRCTCTIHRAQNNQLSWGFDSVLICLDVCYWMYTDHHMEDAKSWSLMHGPIWSHNSVSHCFQIECCQDNQSSARVVNTKKLHSLPRFQRRKLYHAQNMTSGYWNVSLPAKILSSVYRGETSNGERKV